MLIYAIKYKQKTSIHNYPYGVNINDGLSNINKKHQFTTNAVICADVTSYQI